MGKLIDTEELKAKIDEKESRRNEPAWYDGLDTCREIIEDMPAVDAIPVEWLRDKMMERQTLMTKNPYGYVLAEWLEQEAR